MGEKCEEITKCKVVVTKQSWNVMYSTGNIVSNTDKACMMSHRSKTHQGKSLHKLYKYPTIILYTETKYTECPLQLKNICKRNKNLEKGTQDTVCFVFI